MRSHHEHGHEHGHEYEPTNRESALEMLNKISAETANIVIADLETDREVEILNSKAPKLLTGTQMKKLLLTGLALLPASQSAGASAETNYQQVIEPPKTSKAQATTEIDVHNIPAGLTYPPENTKPHETEPNPKSKPETEDQENRVNPFRQNEPAESEPQKKSAWTREGLNLPEKNPYMNQMVDMFGPKMAGWFNRIMRWGDPTQGAVYGVNYGGECFDYNPRSLNINRDADGNYLSEDRGLMAINSKTFATLQNSLAYGKLMRELGINSFDDMYDPVKNMQVGFMVFNELGFGAWYARDKTLDEITPEEINKAFAQMIHHDIKKGRHYAQDMEDVLSVGRKLEQDSNTIIVFDDLIEKAIKFRKTND